MRGASGSLYTYIVKFVSLTLMEGISPALVVRAGGGQCVEYLPSHVSHTVTKSVSMGSNGGWRRRLSAFSAVTIVYITDLLHLVQSRRVRSVCQPSLRARLTLLLSNR